MRVLRGLASGGLPCGCLIGVYETYGGDVVTLLDVRAADCKEPAHKGGAVVQRVPWRGQGPEPDPREAARG